jgi:predicted nuclease with RNAse H fold
MTAVGIDVGGRRKGFHGCAMRGREIVAGPERLADVGAAVEWIVALAPSTVAIDSPCEGAPAGTRSRPDEHDFFDAGICHIRWTPAVEFFALNPPYYEWIVHGFELYDALAERLPSAHLIETFPTAAWTSWAGSRGKPSRARWSRDALAALDLANVPSRHNQDDRDAIAAGLVAQLHDEGAKTRAFGRLIVPADGPPAAPRRARTSQAPLAADRGRRGPGRRG